MSIQYDVLVVGGGPVGARVAAQLAQSGVRVALCEKQPSFHGPVCCTGLVSEECRRRFALDAGLVQRSFRGARVNSPGGRTLELRRPEVQASLVDRPGLNRLLAARATSAGATYLYGHEVTRLTISSDMAAAEAGGQTLTARAAVLAPGFNSPLLAQAGLGRGRAWTMGVQARVASPASEIEVYLGRRFAPGSFAWLVPAEEGCALAGLMAGRETKRHFAAFLAWLEKQGRITSAGPAHLRGITLSPPRRTCGPRVLVVGDAAGQVKPLTGGGLYYGLLSADLAASCLAQALQDNDLSARRLSFYEKEWHNLLSHELRLARGARRAFGLLSDREIDLCCALATRLKLPARLARAPELGFDWHGRALAQAWRLFVPGNLEGENHGG